MHAVPVEHQDKPAKPMNPKSLPVRPGEDPWTKAELNEVKQALTEDIARFQSQIEISTAELVGLLRDGSEGAGRDPADVGSANFERDAEMSLANNAREMLEQSRLALRHIELGTYGSCDNCGQPIGKGRLQAFPPRHLVCHVQAARGTAISPVGGARPIERRRWRLLVAVVAVAGLTADLVTKIIAVTQLEPLVPVRLLGGLLTLRLIRNPGAAFSQGQRFTYVFAIAAIAVLCFVIIKLVPRIGHPAWAVAIGLLCAGVAGNLTDRLFRPPGVLRGHVIDFLELPYWPIFNVADMCITAAAIMIMFLSVVKGIAITGERHVRSAAWLWGRR